MKINPLGPMNNPYQKQADMHRPGKQNASKQERDKVEISKEAQHMQQERKLDALRQEKINELKQKVQSGNYQMDPKETARKFYDFWTGK